MFSDRYGAGKLLADALSEYKDKKDTIILAIPRGALQIGEVLHQFLNLPLDVIITKKIPHPMSEEFAIGAVGAGGAYFLNLTTDVPNSYIEAQRAKIEKLVEEKYKTYVGSRPRPVLAGKTVILVDDGIATGSTILAAIKVIKKQSPAEIVVAVPVASQGSLKKIKSEASKIVCLEIPLSFFAIGDFYKNFPQVEDAEAIQILKKCLK